MAKCIFENLTPEQAKILVEWYEGQGEQDAIVWFECNGNSEVPCADVGRKGGCMKIDKSTGDVTLWCK